MYASLPNSSPGFIIFTTDVAFAGWYTLSVKTYLIQDSFNFEQWIKLKLNITIPTCENATWNPNEVKYMTTTVNASPPLDPQTFTESSVISTLSCGTVAYYLNDTLSVVTLNENERTITVASTDSS